MKKRYKVLIIIGALIVAVVIAGVIAFSVISKNLEELVDTRIAEVDLSAVEDGVYTGSYGSLPVTAEVEVTVSGGVITDITVLEHSHGPDRGADAIADEVLEEQSLKVDAISGATYSSKVILKAIEDALAGE